MDLTWSKRPEDTFSRDVAQLQNFETWFCLIQIEMLAQLNPFNNKNTNIRINNIDRTSVELMSHLRKIKKAKVNKVESDKN